MNRDQLIEYLGRSNDVIILDGGMGSLLAEKGWTPPSLPEEMILERPDMVEGIHDAYCRSGAQIIETNTFGGSALKLSHRGLEGRTSAINAEAARLAKKAAQGRALVAGSVGPLGELIAPFGTLTFQEAYSAFLPQMEGLAEGGADFLLIETMMDLREAKAAILAAKDAAPGMAFVVSFTFDHKGRTVTGTPPEVAARWADLAGAAGVGANCGVGPEKYVEAVGTLSLHTALPVFVYANAGLPGEAGYLSPEQFSRWAPRLADSGAWVVGGCCGTTPDHIAAVHSALRRARRAVPSPTKGTPMASRSRLILAGDGHPFCVIGERINVSRPSPLRDEVSRSVWTTLRDEAQRQTEAGAHVLDVNVGLPTINQSAAIVSAIAAVEQTSNLPISIDSDSHTVMESGLTAVTGIPLINSLTARETVLSDGLSLAKRHGASVVVLPMDEEGIPEDGKRRRRIIEKILNMADAVGYPREGLVIDGLALAVGAGHRGPSVTLDTLSFLRDIGVSSLLGVSNVSHGMPGRPLLNRTFLAMAVSVGLSAAILNPLDDAMMETLSASELLAGRDPQGERYLTAMARRTPSVKKGVPLQGRLEEDVPVADDSALLAAAILRGDGDRAEGTGRRMLSGGIAPLDLVHKGIIPALDEVGRLYDCGTLFLPQLISSAEAAQRVCAIAMDLVERAGGVPRGKIVLATVEGDLHDLGKNVVSTVLKSHGFSVTDLGRDVPAASIVREARDTACQVVGLSALMTSTMTTMASTVATLRRELPEVLVIVGGASVNGEYAASIGADGYAPDAVGAVKLVDSLLARTPEHETERRA